jgi:hypothetical protein
METYYLHLYSAPVVDWINSHLPDDSGYPGQGYVHRHGGDGKMFPKRLRKKPRNRKGRR